MERNKEKSGQTRFNFSFIKNEPHSTTDELFILNKAVYLTNCLVEHRGLLQTDIDNEAAKFEMGDQEKRICRLIVEEIEKVGGGKYRALPRKILDEGRRQAMSTVFEEWDHVS